MPDVAAYPDPVAEVTAESLTEALRARGLRITEPRRAVCAVVASSRGEHLNAADVFERARHELGADIDRSTVYRTLEALEAAGLVRHGHIGHGPTVYHLAAEAPHQHLVCRNCGTTTSILGSDLEELLARIEALTGFRADLEHFSLSGRCARCAVALAPRDAAE